MNTLNKTCVSVGCCEKHRNLVSPLCNPCRDRLAPKCEDCHVKTAARPEADGLRCVPCRKEHRADLTYNARLKEKRKYTLEQLLAKQAEKQREAEHNYRLEIKTFTDHDPVTNAQRAMVANQERTKYILEQQSTKIMKKQKELKDAEAQKERAAEKQRLAEERKHYKCQQCNRQMISDDFSFCFPCNKKRAEATATIQRVPCNTCEQPKPDNGYVDCWECTKKVIKKCEKCQVKYHKRTQAVCNACL